MNIAISIVMVGASLLLPVVGQAKDAASKPQQIAAAEATSVSPVNTFNRLLKKPEKKNAPPAEDGIHDADNDNTFVLQPPKVAFDAMPASEFGNYVNWVTAMQQNKISPRTDRLGTGEEPMIMDLDIIREVKSSVADVIFPHKAHTEWLHCSNCHPDIFVPQQGGNRMNMSQIMLGQKCGVCHGKVAFPVTTKTCKLCHAKAKPAGWKPPKSAASEKNPWM